MPVVVPDHVDSAINEALDNAIEDLSEETPKPTDEEREALYNQLLRYYDDHGTIPEFSITIN